MPDLRDGRLPEHVTTPLLTLITEHSLDDDYRRGRAAPRHRGCATRRRAGRAWVAAAVVAVFGVLVTTAAVQTSRNADTADAGRATLIAQGPGRASRPGAAAGTRSWSSSAPTSTSRSVARTSSPTSGTTDRAAAPAPGRHRATPPVTGPGVRIVVDDAPGGDVTQLVRDEDLALLVDGLWGAGAEAISINDQRLTALSAIRNVGPAVHVNSRPVNPPYTVQAIGDTLTLQADLLDTTHGQQFFDLADDLGFEYAMENEHALTLPSAPGPRLRHVEAGTGDGQGRQQEEEAAP